jgi:hypothetical protein
MFLSVLDDLLTASLIASSNPLLDENPADRDLYLRTKQELAQKDWNYVQNYADAKSKVVASIIERARSSRLEVRD